MKFCSKLNIHYCVICSGWDDWQFWYWGFLPIGLCLIATVLDYHFIWRNIQDVSAPLDDIATEDEGLKSLDIEIGGKDINEEIDASCTKEQ